MQTTRPHLSVRHPPPISAHCHRQLAAAWLLCVCVPPVCMLLAAAMRACVARTCCAARRGCTLRWRWQWQWQWQVPTHTHTHTRPRPRPRPPPPSPLLCVCAIHIPPLYPCLHPSRPAPLADTWLLCLASPTTAQRKRQGGETASVRKRSKSYSVSESIEDMPVDPNEPTYCLCHQVSYGEMIACDNADVRANLCLFAIALGGQNHWAEPRTCISLACPVSVPGSVPGLRACLVCVRAWFACLVCRVLILQATTVWHGTALVS